MGSSIQQALIFIVQFIFGLYAFSLVLRIWMRALHADYLHPFVNSIDKITTPVVKPFVKFIPDFKKIELAGVVVLLIVTLIKLFLMSIIAGQMPNMIGLLIWSVGSIVETICDAVFYMMVIMALLSWMPQVQPMLFSLLHQLTQPLLQPVRRIIPLLGGMDLSPIVALLIAQILNILIAHPIMRVGLNAALH